MVLVCSGTFILPNVEASHDPNDFFVEDFNGVPAGEIHGNIESNLWKVFELNTNAFIRSSPNVWLPVPTGLEFPHTVYALSSTNVYIGGVELANEDAPEFSRCTAIPTPSCVSENIPGIISANSIYAASSTDIWVSAQTNGPVNFGALVHWNGVSWSAPIETQRLLVIHGFASNDIWGISEGFAMWRYDGVSWAQTGNPTPSDGFLIPSNQKVFWGSSSSNLYVGKRSGMVGRIYRTTDMGANWNLLSSSIDGVSAIYGSSGTNIWAVGLGVFHSTDGTTFSNTNPSGPMTERIIISVWTSSSSIVYIGDSMNGVIGTIYRLQSNPAVGVPSLVGLQWDPNDLFVTASQAQCNGDPTGLGVNIEPSLGAGGLSAFVLNSETGVVVETFPQASFFNLQDKHFHQDRFYPVGRYSFLVTADVIGLLTPDNYAATEFSVPVGTCVDSADQDLIPFLENHFEQTDSYVNSTNSSLHSDHIIQGLYSHCQNTSVQIGDCQGIHSNLTEVHSHIDSHFDEVLLAIMTGNQTNGSATLQIDLEGFEFIVWILIVAVAIFAAFSNRTMLIILSFPIGIFSAIYGMRAFESQVFDLVAILVGILLTVIAFNGKEEKQQEKKKNVD